MAGKSAVRSKNNFRSQTDNLFLTLMLAVKVIFYLSFSLYNK